MVEPSCGQFSGDLKAGRVAGILWVLGLFFKETDPQSVLKGLPLEK